ncbi:pre-rRNA processing protein Utp22 [Talaromyces proteolyticus]|uniref:U3 small nucleolar RNA-associated protein 22 n=1 Tax=Talaromyces proteolyticus TaxID=1131652 RepID=A0AAD4KFB0_9EURO|nr:pre-rRNA processing protein Utp22 [Talaromyces proteolyticus]KAH8688888.1 pre-rRNA processing protein Utp22 [Talaromyces proteolyticus]
MSDHHSKRRKLNDTDVTVTDRDQSKQTGVQESNHGSDKPTAQSSFPERSQRRESRFLSGQAAEIGKATGLSKSALFKLQTDELLAELRPNYDDYVSHIQSVLRKVKDTIYQTPSRLETQPCVAQKEMRNAYKIIVPFPHPTPDESSRYPMSFLPPTDVNVVGSLYLRAGMHATEVLIVDLAVTMPSAIFQPKDFRNYRYFHKRAYYIACIAASLQKGNFPFTLHYSHQDGDSLRPIIVMEPSEDKPSNSFLHPFRIRIVTTVDDDAFPLSHTLPHKNNIRNTTSDDQQSPGEEKLGLFYNAALRSDITVVQYQKWLQSAMKKNESMRDACTLGQIWLQQRGFGSSLENGGFGSFEWMVLLGLLFEGGGASGKPVLMSSYSGYQIFKATLQFLSARDLTHPLSLFTNDVKFPAGEPVLYDGKRGLNILYKMTAWSYKLLRHECKLALSLLNDPLFDNFNKVFILQTDDPMLKFDRLVRLTPPQKPVGSLSLLGYQNHVNNILERSLGDRVKAIHIWTKSPSSWKLTSDRANRVLQDHIYIGLQLDPENTDRLIDHGPSVEMQDEAQSYREFWGEKAELRRFRDGRILESLVWSEEEPVVDQILVYALCRHLEIPRESISCIGGEFDKALQRFSRFHSHTPALFQKFHDAFQSLQSSLQNMDDIPLSIRQLLPASAALRNTAIALGPDGIERIPVDIILQLESSAKWPDNLVGIQMTKVAFLERIGDLLKENDAIQSFRVGLENESRPLMNQAFLDIIHTSGLIFRLRIHHDREATLLERKLKEGNTNGRLKENAAAALSEYKKVFVQSPRLTQTIKTLSTRSPLLSPTIRLMKHWFNSQLLSYVTEEFVELITINSFVSLHPWDPPSSLMSGFYRTLTLLSKWNWQQEPLILNMGGLDSSDIKTIETRFLAWRNIDPAMKKVAMVIASDIDQEGVTWTLNERPPKVVASHISRLAQAAVEALSKQPDDVPLDSLFKPRLASYDFLIYLDQKQVNASSKNAVKFKNLSLPAADVSQLQNIGRLYLDELKVLFGNCALFFYNNDQCAVIAGLWKPDSATPKSFSLRAAYSTSPAADVKTDQDLGVVLNKKSILNEIARLGGPLVHRIECRGN